jgi:hypothetical protein
MRRIGVGIGSVIGLLAVAAPAAPAAAPSLYQGPPPRPGPGILYGAPAEAPQLRNQGVWHAEPILVSGSSAYRRGEFLYQDFLYDDHGAKALGRDPGDPRVGDDSFSAPNGTYTYPTDPAYANNAADLVEFRVQPLSGSTAFRITLNTIRDPALVGTTVAIGGSGQPREFPHGANATAPASLFLTVHGGQADLINAATGRRINPAPRVSISTSRRQIEVRIPHSAWDPGSRTVRLTAGVGLWDGATNRYLLPGAAADASHPGGAAGLANPTAFFNVAFRFGEPWQHPFPPDSVFANPAWWRDRQQGTALAEGDLSPFGAQVDFGKLEREVTDNQRGEPDGVPLTGPMDRILASHFESQQGVRYTPACGQPTDCQGELRGRLQPYAIYVPHEAAPVAGYGLTLLLHSLGANYNQFGDTRNQSQLGDRGPGSIVITPEGRGPDGWYYGHAGADTFEVWADVARHYPLDPGWTSIAGYSMGGYGTYKFAAQYPDLFARANPVVGPPGLGIWLPPAPPQPGGEASNTNRMLPSVRNLPFLIWNGAEDQLVPVPGPLSQAQGFDDLGYRYTFDLFTTADHFTLAVEDQYAPVATFLGTHRVRRNPPHVSYVVNPTMDFAGAGTVADHAYWLSGLRLRNAGGAAPLGSIDARSEGFGRADPAPKPTRTSPANLLEGGNLPPLNYSERRKSWGPERSVPTRDLLHLDAHNLARAVVHPARAQLSCHPRLDVSTDGPLTVTLAGCSSRPPLHFGD